MAITLQKSNTSSGGGIKLDTGASKPFLTPDQIKSFQTGKPTDDTAAPADKPLLQGGLGQKIARFFTGGLQQVARDVTQSVAAPKQAEQFAEVSGKHDELTKNLTTLIQDKKKLGQDTSQLEVALKSHIASTPNSKDFISSVVDKSKKQWTGDILGAVTDVAGMGIGGGAAKKLATTATEDLVKQGAKTGAKIGGIFGAGSGASEALKKDEGAGGVVKGATVGGIFGAATGGTIGAVGGKISQKVLQRSEDELGKLIEETSGVADKKSRISTFEKTGALDKNGKPIGGTKESLFGGIKTKSSPADIARAKSVQGIVKPGASPVENLTNLNKEISRISEDEIAPALEKAGSISPISDKAPGWSPITKRLADIEKPDIIKADPTLDKTYDLVRQRMIEQIKKQPPTVKGLWDARKAFDKVVEDQFGDAAFNSEKNTAIKRAITDMRREVNNIIGDRVPEYKELLNQLSNMYDARYNIAENFQNILDKGGRARFKVLNPKKYATLKWGTGLVSSVAVGEGVKKVLTGEY